MALGSFDEIQMVAITREESIEVGFHQPMYLCIVAVGFSLDAAVFVTG